MKKGFRRQLAISRYKPYLHSVCLPDKFAQKSSIFLTIGFEYCIPDVVKLAAFAMTHSHAYGISPDGVNDSGNLLDIMAIFLALDCSSAYIQLFVNKDDLLGRSFSFCQLLGQALNLLGQGCIIMAKLRYTMPFSIQLGMCILFTSSIAD